jgi:hypothetical protein
MDVHNKNFFFVETPFYLQSVYIHSANWCEDLDNKILLRHSIMSPSPIMCT